MAVSAKTLEAIKSGSLSKVIEASDVKLRRVGYEFVTQCPWHDDTNPSLTINDNKGFCFCHVCRGGGDVISYLQQRFGLHFQEAAERAASILEVPFELDNEDPEETARRRRERQQAIEALGREQARYKAMLRDPKASRIRQIILDRGLSREAAVEFGLGFAPDGFFAGRITIPIYNHRNELIGFSGRATRLDQDAKYKNSSDSSLFQKKQIVFNEFRGLEAAREAGSLVFVEGHLDVVSMWQAGIRNVVAIQGTGTPDPLVLKRLCRSVKNFVLCFDGDAGGIKATELFLATAGPMALAGELSINVVSLPDGQDPDEVIRSGGDLYGHIVSAPCWLDWVIDTWAMALDKTNFEQISEVESKLRVLIDGIRSKALRAHYIDRAARVLTKTEKEAEKLAKEWGNQEFFSSSASWKPRSAPEGRLQAERRLLRLYVHAPELREALRGLLERVGNPALRWLSKRLLELEELSAVDLTPHTAMAIVVVAEPHYMQQLRALVRPNVIIDKSPEVLRHLAAILHDEVTVPTEIHESNPDQPSA